MAVSGLILFFLLLFLLTTLFKGGKNEEPPTTPPPKEVEKVELKKQNKKEDTSETPQTSSYFLKPAASEIIENFASMDSYQLKVESKKLPGLRIAWPVFFYSLKPNEAGTSTLTLDSLENGFGVAIVCDLETSQYPELSELEQGRKFWIAGEVTGVDPEGLGQIFINMEHFTLDENPGWDQFPVGSQENTQPSSTN